MTMQLPMSIWGIFPNVNQNNYQFVSSLQTVDNKVKQS